MGKYLIVLAIVAILYYYYLHQQKVVVPAPTVDPAVAVAAQSFAPHKIREGYWPKLGHLLGSQDAGGSVQHFGSDTGVGTFLQGYARPTFMPSTLPRSVYLQGA